MVEIDPGASINYQTKEAGENYFLASMVFSNQTERIELDFEVTVQEVEETIEPILDYQLTPEGEKELWDSLPSPIRL